MTAALGADAPKADRSGTSRPAEAAPAKGRASSAKRKGDAEAYGNYLVKRKADGRFIIQLVEDAIPEERRSPARHDLTCEDCEKVKRRRRIERKEREVKAAQREVKRRLRALGVTATQIR